MQTGWMPGWLTWGGPAGPPPIESTGWLKDTSQLLSVRLARHSFRSTFPNILLFFHQLWQYVTPKKMFSYKEESLPIWLHFSFFPSRQKSFHKKHLPTLLLTLLLPTPIAHGTFTKEISQSQTQLGLCKSHPETPMSHLRGVMEADCPCPCPGRI